MKVFRRVRDLVKDADTVTRLEVSCVIFNCCFFIKNETESSLKVMMMMMTVIIMMIMMMMSSLKANALEALNSVAKIMEVTSRSDPNVSKFLIDKVCFDHIKAGIKSKDDSVRSDFLSFLQSLVLHCACAR